MPSTAGSLVVLGGRRGVVMLGLSEMLWHQFTGSLVEACLASFGSDFTVVIFPGCFCS